MNTDFLRALNMNCDRSGKLKHAAITEAIIGAFYDVYNELGQGFLESVYPEALALVLVERGLKAEKEKSVVVNFRGAAVGIFRTDLLVNNAVVVELKCARSIDHPMKRS